MFILLRKKNWSKTIFRLILCYCIARIQQKAKSNNRFLQYCSLRGFGPVFWIYRLDGPSVWTWLTGHGGIFCCGRVFSWKWHHHTWCISERYSKLIVDQLHVVDVFIIIKMYLFVYYDSFSSLKVRVILCQFFILLWIICVSVIHVTEGISEKTLWFLNIVSCRPECKNRTCVSLYKN